MNFKHALLAAVAYVAFSGMVNAAEEGVFKKGYVLSVITVTTSKEEADKFVQTFEKSPRASHKMAGFLGLAVAQNSKDSGSFLVISMWKDEASLQAYVKSPGFGEDHANMGAIQSAKTGVPGRFVVKEN
jgi:heme-degrading monooxygenase HmoA